MKKLNALEASVEKAKTSLIHLLNLACKRHVPTEMLVDARLMLLETRMDLLEGNAAGKDAQ